MLFQAMLTCPFPAVADRPVGGKGIDVGDASVVKLH
jgi:hypothetical protein